MSTAELPSPILQIERNRTAGGSLAVLELLWCRRSLLWKSALAGFVVALVIAFLIPPQYESTTRLMPPDPQAMSGVGMAAAVMSTLPPGAADIAGNLFGFKAQGATFVAVLQSRTVLDSLINRFDLRKVYGFKRYVDARKKLASRTSVAEDTKSGVITVTVLDNDPNRARSLATAYVEELNVLISQVSTSSARREREFLEERLKKVKQDLDDASARVSSFSSGNMTFDPQLQGKAMLDAAVTLQGQLIAAESELSGLEQIYGPENSRVKAGRARVGELRSRLRSIRGRNGGSETNLSGGLAPSGFELYPSLEQLPLLGSTYVDLARRAKIDEAIFEVLTKQYELAKVQEAKEIPAVKAMDSADLPERKSFPPRSLIALAGAFLSVAISGSWLALQRNWHAMDSDDPRKSIIYRIAADLRIASPD
jgi:uncharacterized protein involved in exopolysaccharide biosynthesis